MKHMPTHDQLSVCRNAQVTQSKYDLQSIRYLIAQVILPRLFVYGSFDMMEVFPTNITPEKHGPKLSVEQQATKVVLACRQDDLKC